MPLLSNCACRKSCEKGLITKEHIVMHTQILYLNRLHTRIKALKAIIVDETL